MRKIQGYSCLDMLVTFKALFTTAKAPDTISQISTTVITGALEVLNPETHEIVCLHGTNLNVNELKLCICY